jgi:hypothetical protein
MNRFCLIALLLVCFAFSGCRSQRTNAYQELQRRAERFHLEDQIFALKAKVETLESELKSCKRDNRVLRSGDKIGQGSSRGSNTLDVPDPDTLLPSGDLKLEGFDTLDSGGNDDPLPAPPSNYNEPASSGGESKNGESSVIRESSASLQGPRLTVQSEASDMPQIDAARTGGFDDDQQPGDDGLLVLLRAPLRPASIDVALLDPALAGDPEARVGNWHLDAQAVARQWRDHVSGGQLLAKLNWPNQPPRSRHLRLYVRTVTADGQSTIVEQDVQVKLATGRARVWKSVSSKTSAASTDPSQGPAAKKPQSQTRRGRKLSAQKKRPAWTPYR